jgi:hypothetical protein
MFPNVDHCKAMSDTVLRSMWYKSAKGNTLKCFPHTTFLCFKATVKTLHNPYTLSFSEKRVRRILRKLNTLIELIERDYYLDRDHFQLLLESHWLSSNVAVGTVFLPSWNLYLFAALQSDSIAADPETHEALRAVAAELRN